MTELDDLRTGIRAKILTGDLPKEDCRMTWFGPGRRATCVACDRVIEPGEVEVACDLPRGGTINFHLRCYQIWVAEWRNY